MTVHLLYRAHESEQVEVASEKRVVKEDDDWWIIPDTVLTKEGVMNRGLKPWEELVKTARMWENVPIIYPHPKDVVGPGDLPMVGGFIRNIRLDAKSKRILGDAYFAKRSLSDFEVSTAAVELNTEAVERFRKGEEIHNSIGFLYHKEPKKGKLGDRDYDHVQRNLKPDHLAMLGMGKNRDKGACDWGYGCGLGRGQEVRLEQFAGENNGAHTTSIQRHPMPCDASKAVEHEQLEVRAKAMETELRGHKDNAGQLAKNLGLAADASCTQVADAVKNRLDRLTVLETTEKTRLDAVALETAKLEVGGDYAKDQEVKAKADALAKTFSTWPLAALEHHRNTLRIQAADDEKAPIRGDKSLVSGRGNDAGQLGVASTNQVWPKKGGSQ